MGARRREEERSSEVDPILRTKTGRVLGVACSVTHPDSTPSLRDLRFRLWELWETRSVFQAVVGERFVSLVHDGGSFHGPVLGRRVV
jgi:hypothetical protein